MITYNIVPGTADVSVVIRIVDSADGTPETGVVFNTSGIDLQYRREGAASTAITEATLAALTTAHTDGGFLHIGNGYYRLDLPDAACASGVAGVLVHGVVTGMVVIGCYIQLEGAVNSTYARIGAPAGASVSADIAAIEAQTDDIGAAGAGLTAIPWNAAWDAEVQSEVADGLAAAEPLDANVTQWAGSAVATPTVNGVPEVDVTHWLGSAATALNTAEDLGLMVETTIATLASQTSFTLTAGSADNDAYNGRLIVIEDASTAAQKCVGEVSDYVGASKTVTLAADPAIFTIATTDNVRIFAAPASGSGPSAATIADAVWDEAQADHVTAGSFGEVATETAAILVDTGTTLDGRIPAALVSGRMDASVGAMAANVMTAAAAAADLTTELQSGLATAAALDTIDNFLDAEVASILTKITGMVPVSGTIGATGNSTTALHLSGLAWADDAPNSMLLTIQDVSTGLFYSRWIEDFATTGDLATVATLPFTPEASVDLYWVMAPRADVTGGSGLDAAGVRAAVGLASANLDTQLGDLPTNAELATSQGTADDATLAAIAAVDAKIDTIDTNVDSILVDTAEIGAAGAGLTVLATQASVNTIDDLLDTEIAALTTAVADLPTNAELATALGTADDAVLAAIAALNNLSAAQVATEIADALGTDTYAEPTGVPAATATLANKLSFVYMALRNRIDVTATKKTFYDDGGASEWEKDLTDDGTTYSESEANAI